MSAQAQIKRQTVVDIVAHKNGQPVVMLTAYTAPMAKLFDPHVDMLLVGDSLGMVLYGMDTTLPVTLEMMIAHGAAVVRGSQQAMVVVDMPFGSYQESPAQAFRNAARVLSESGAAAVKLEGGEEMAETVEFLVRRGVPVVGHVGLTPQHVNAFGGFRSRGRSEAEADKIRRDAQAISDAGAFAMVIEGTVEQLAREITASVNAVTIGIGASPACDGQVLVSEDILGLFTDFRPKFVKRYADLASTVSDAAATYADEVRSRAFPSAEYCFGVKKG
ncbi:3-methyl-2-oxobutanoate hydroxymethyltransferase [Insolitispirillum peregrinum]|uniref:3-methyl-2-oxobutanoate hydroxymethyltransferase n=1 Tax=Insolitispirillum peregrinum TaxID=80876 RepID=A0A1N7KE22_9PROT|nr:3-methyl-2-oxobutanoate hydroxymethyltransferase [Insolitispirillum peregrinum]SIS59831.1 ketopantoate hydroxymethyltransferase [Insolitispirillum peregrinum]